VVFCVGSDDDYDKSEEVKPFFSKESYKRIIIRKSHDRGAGSTMICSSQYKQNGSVCCDYYDKK
jgi:hypothetical protein